MFRADAAFAKPEIFKALEERGVKYAIRIPGEDGRQADQAPRCCWLMLAESHLTRRLFGSMVRRFDALAVATG
jgi:hypothetical protein